MGRTETAQGLSREAVLWLLRALDTLGLEPAGVEAGENRSHMVGNKQSSSR